METNETRKGKYSKIILKEKKFKKKKPNKEQKIRKNKTYNNEEKPYLKKNEVCLLSPNFKVGEKFHTENQKHWTPNCQLG